MICNHFRVMRIGLRCFSYQQAKVRLKAGCGIALRVADHLGAKALLQENNIVVTAVYQAAVNAQETVYNEIMR